MQCVGLPRLEAIDDASVHSLRSVDSVASVEVHALISMRHPPRNLVLAASACVILLTPGPEVRKTDHLTLICLVCADL